MAKLLLVYSTNDGQTLKIVKNMAEHLKQANKGLIIDVVEDCKLKDVNVGGYDKVLIGAAIKYGYFKKAVYDFVRENKAFLEASGSGFFGVCLTARKPEKRVPENSAYLRKFLLKSGWQPKHITAIAGALNYTHYNLFETMMIKLIMTMTKGSTDTSRDLELTDWQQVKDFALKFGADIA